MEVPHGRRLIQTPRKTSIVPAPCRTLRPQQFSQRASLRHMLAFASQRSLSHLDPIFGGCHPTVPGANPGCRHSGSGHLRWALDLRRGSGEGVHWAGPLTGRGCRYKDGPRCTAPASSQRNVYAACEGQDTRVQDFHAAATAGLLSPGRYWVKM